MRRRPARVDDISGRIHSNVGAGAPWRDVLLSFLARDPAPSALASLLEPKLPSLLRRVVAMGGAIDAPGNVALAEANFNHDARAWRASW